MCKIMSARVSWLQFAVLFMFARGLLVSTTPYLHHTPADVFENSSVMLILTFDNKAEYSTTWQVNTTVVGFVVLKDGVCTNGDLLNDTTIYKVSCNTTTVSIEIIHANRAMHDGNWLAGYLGVLYSTTIVVQVPVRYVNLSSNIPLLDRTISLNETDQLNIKCQSSYSIPGSSLLLYASNDSATETQLFLQNQTSYNTDDTGLVQTVSTFVFQTSRNWNGWNIFCKSSIRAHTDVRSNTLKLNIKFPPRMPPFIKNLGPGRVYSIMENKTGSMTCSIDESNPLAKLAWTCTNQGLVNVTDIDKTSLAIQWTALRNDITRCTCTSMHILNSTSISVDINVLYPPKMITVNISIDSKLTENISGNGSVIENKLLSLSCSADGNPKASKYSWSGLASSNLSEVRFTADRNRSGILSCEASNEMTEVPANITTPGSLKTAYIFLVLYPASILPMQNASVIVGRSFNKTCLVIPGNSGKETVKWITTRPGDVDSSNSMLIIKNVTKDHKGEHTCSVNSTMSPTYGQAEFAYNTNSFYLEVKYPPEHISVSFKMGLVTEDNIATILRVIENAALQMALKCSASGNPLPSSYKWIGHQMKDSEMLDISAVKKFSGNYVCIAINNMTETSGYSEKGQTNKTYFVDILYPPVIKTFLQNVSVIEGNSTIVLCEIIPGNPSLTDIRWINTPGNKGVLHISKVNRTDSRWYKCEANNTMNPNYGGTQYGNDTWQLYLDVLYPPEHMSINSTTAPNHIVSNSISIIENTSFKLRCFAESKPPPSSFSWSGYNSSNTTEVYIHGSRTKRNNITCLTKNIMTEMPGNNTVIGMTRHTLFVEVLYPPEIEDIQERKVIEGQDYSISCFKSSGKTTSLSVKWIKDNNEISNNLNSNLNIPNLRRNHTGRYSCFIQYAMEPTYGSPIRENKTSSFSLDVFYPPELIDISLEVDSYKVVNITKRVSVIENASLVLNCSALGNPLPSNYTWTGYNTNIHSAVLTLHVTRYMRGNFTCIANNKMNLSNGTSIIGSDSQIYEIDVQYPPELTEERYITIPEGKDVTLTCVLDYGRTVHSAVRWISSNGTTIQGFDNLTILNVSRSSSGNYTCETNYTMAPSYRDPITPSMTKTVYLEVTYATYDEQKTPPGGGNAGQVAGGVIGGLLGIGAVVAAVFLVRRRGLLSKGRNDDGGHHEYQNVGFTGELKQSKRLPALPPDDESEDIHGDHRTIAQQQDYDAEEHPYLNTMELIDLMKKVSVADLFSYVTNKSYQEFSDEFGKFPSGLMVEIPCSIASKPKNAALNRYQGIYPYDHSRVIILGQPDFFINASYIDGNSGSKEYIASLGPTVKHTLGFQTFWNMVWHEQSDVIVMLTNLQEPSGMKCEKYWAESGTTRNIGDFTIQSIGEEVTAEYKVRTFKVFKDDESRMVTQLHYTAWPDKKVPEDVTSLIEFRQRVKAAPTRSSGPLIVHCSAGVGRTGTYIALDRLIKEGKSKNAINVYDCVMNMRKQRVNMVQTLDQYIYLHQALVYCLVFDIEPVSSGGIEEYVKKTSNNVYSKLFQQLQQTVEDETIEEKEARARNGDMLEKNRKTADIPSDAYRIRLFLDKQMGESDYINAVYLNGFKRLGHFIIAQSPLPTTLDDFVCLLYQANCCCIVSLDDYLQTGASNVTYLPPDNQPMKYGTFTISCTNLDVKSGYSVRKLKLGHTGQFENGERIVYHFEFTGWRHDERTPKDPKLFVDFVKEVDKHATQLEDENSHVLVHCITGSERSGLFCALYNLMDKMEQERQVSVVNMLRRIRARRRSAITNMEQLKFCYQALNAFVKSYKI